MVLQTMVVSNDQEGKAEDCNELRRDVGQSVVSTINTRKGGNTEPNNSTRVIVDMREFRSELPALIHRRGIDIDPITLQVMQCLLSPLYLIIFIGVNVKMCSWSVSSFILQVQQVPQ